MTKNFNIYYMKNHVKISKYVYSGKYMNVSKICAYPYMEMQRKRFGRMSPVGHL